MRFKILHTNDVHSSFENFGKITTKIKELKDENTLVLDAGDFIDFKDVMIEGTNGIAGVDLLVEGGYEAITIGNNEGFAGMDALKSMVDGDRIPFLSCNLIKLDGSSIEGIKRSVILEKSGVRFLVIGAIPEYKEFLNLLGMDASDCKEEILKEMKNNFGKYDICILLSHLGLSMDKEIAEKIDGVDIIINGHNHILMKEPECVNNTTIHMWGCYAEHLGILEFDYDGSVSNIRGVNISINNEEIDKNILNIIEKNKKIANDNLGAPIYRIHRDMWHDVVEENPMTNLLADALKDVLKCDIGLINSGIISSGIRTGEVSLKKLLEICPSPLNPTYIEIQGKYIKEALEKSLNTEVCYKDGHGAGFRGRFLGKLHVSGVKIEHNGINIFRILVNGKELDEDRYYKVATSDYLQRGTGYEDLANNINEKYNPEYIRATLKDYLCKKDFVEKAFEDRWIRME